MQALAFYLVFPLIWLVARLPFRVIYVLSDFVFLILFYVVRYRRETVLKNLSIAFPDRTQEELYELAKKSTSHFCDLFIEMIKSTAISKKELQRRFVCDNVEEINAFAKANQPIVMMIGHQASYEWTMALDEVIKLRTYAVYKPIKNKYFDRFIRKVRSKFGTDLVPMKQVYSKVRESQKSTREAGLFALVADQAPKRSAAQYFTQFFDTTTPVFMGGERIAKEYSMPVYFIAIEKVKRGHYKSHFEKITDDASKEEPWYVTDSFFQKLEHEIKKQPEYYLWTHRRWKTSPADAMRAVELSPQVPR